MVSSFYIKKALDSASLYRKNIISSSMSDVLELNEYKIFDTSLTENTFAGYQVYGNNVFYRNNNNPRGASSYNPNFINDFYENLIEVPSSEFVDNVWKISELDQSEVEVLIKNQLQISNVGKYAYYRPPPLFQFINVTWGLPITNNYELYLRILNMTRYFDQSSDFVNCYTSSWDQYLDFIDYDSNGNLIDSGDRVYQGSGIGLPSASGNYVQKIAGVIRKEYSTYYDVTLTRRPKFYELIEEVNLIFQRQEGFSNDPADFFNESKSIKFNLINGYDTNEFRCLNDVVVGSEDNGFYYQENTIQRIAFKGTEYTDIEDVLNKVGYNN